MGGLDVHHWGGGGPIKICICAGGFFFFFFFFGRGHGPPKGQRGSAPVVKGFVVQMVILSISNKNI